MKSKSRLMNAEYEEMRDNAENKLWYPERLDGYLPPTEEVIKIPKIKSKWRHTNGIKYKVILITNETDTEKYPLTVIYKGKNGKIWSRPLSDWYRSFTEIK